MNEHSDWLKVMLEEIERKRLEAREAQEELDRRDSEQKSAALDHGT